MGKIISSPVSRKEHYIARTTKILDFSQRLGEILLIQDARIWPDSKAHSHMPRRWAASPSGASPYGALDMAGNVWEWVTDPYDPTTGRTIDFGNQKVLKGGAFLPGIGAELSKTFVSGRLKQSERPSAVGFRCAKNVAETVAQAH